MRQLMDLSADTKVTKKFLRETMTMSEYESAWQHYSEVLKRHVEEDVLDFHPHGEHVPLGDSEATAGQESDVSEPADTSTASSRSRVKYATPQQVARLKLLAQQVRDDACADVQDMLDHHREGLTMDVYEVVRQRLQDRKAGQREGTSGEGQG
jgi:hypothetical protein